MEPDATGDFFTPPQLEVFAPAEKIAALDGGSNIRVLGQVSLFVEMLPA